MTTTHARGAHEAATRAGFHLDDAQREALPILASFVAGSAPGLYLHGPAGRGKTWLVDALTRGRGGVVRLHLHDFLARLHPVLFAYRVQAAPDAMERALTDVLGEADLFVLDEFHTHDSGDARLLTLVLQTLGAGGVRVLLTSNYPPAALLGDSVWAHTMAEAIALITTAYEVVSLDGGVDHRRAGGFGGGLWMRGASAPAGQATLSSAGRDFTVTGTDGTLDATFAQLCRAETAAMDLVSWARTHDHWRVFDVPVLGNETPSAQQRFVTLIDVLADADVRLDIGSPLSLAEFTARAGSRPDVFRTLSRLRLLSERDHLRDS